MGRLDEYSRDERECMGLPTTADVLVQREQYVAPLLTELTAAEFAERVEALKEDRLVNWIAKRARERVGDAEKTEPCASPFPLDFTGDDEVTLTDVVSREAAE